MTAPKGGEEVGHPSNNSDSNDKKKKHPRIYSENVLYPMVTIRVEVEAILIIITTTTTKSRDEEVAVAMMLHHHHHHHHHYGKNKVRRFYAPSRKIVQEGLLLLLLILLLSLPNYEIEEEVGVHPPQHPLMSRILCSIIIEEEHDLHQLQSYVVAVAMAEVVVCIYLLDVGGRVCLLDCSVGGVVVLLLLLLLLLLLMSRIRIIIAIALLLQQLLPLLLLRIITKNGRRTILPK
jgi:hypothetical protein